MENGITINFLKDILNELTSIHSLLLEEDQRDAFFRLGALEEKIEALCREDKNETKK